MNKRQLKKAIRLYINNGNKYYCKNWEKAYYFNNKTTKWFPINKYCRKGGHSVCLINNFELACCRCHIYVTYTKNGNYKVIREEKEKIIYKGKDKRCKICFYRKYEAVNYESINHKINGSLLHPKYYNELKSLREKLNWHPYYSHLSNNQINKIINELYDLYKQLSIT